MDAAGRRPYSMPMPTAKKTITAPTTVWTKRFKVRDGVVVRPNVRGEAGPAARWASRRKDDMHNLKAAGLPCRWASPRPRG